MTGSIAPKIKFEQKQAPPVLSFMLALLCAIVYIQSATVGSTQQWLISHCFAIGPMKELFANLQALLPATLGGRAGAMDLLIKSITEFCTVAFYATFASADKTWAMGNCYFLYVFGAGNEQRLGPPRYLLLILFSMLVPWPFVLFEAGRIGGEAVYFGPFFLLCTLLGATFVFPPEKKINTEWFKSSRGNIFATEPRAHMTDKYQFKPTFFMILFIVYEGVMWWFLAHSNPLYKTVAVIPGLAALTTGYVVVSLMVWNATGSLKDGALRLQTVRMYNDILKLDVGHDTAIKGTSMALGLPPERVKEWVIAQKGKMGFN
ncbi:MAG: hypothetical protein IPJ49_22205 [Candidatus Obscuribacter sp.]|nr:hypothetical protein [Candidatus Obscuribacter sp.]